MLLKINRFLMNKDSDRQLIQVVPRMTPARCGVSDHAIALASELRSRCGIDSAFVVLNSDERCDVPFQVTYCAQHRLLDTCVSLTGGRPGNLLVHLSGYGYSPDGAPALVADALDRVRADGRFRIAVFFHELYASGPPWTSDFWYARRQKRAYRRIAQVCDLAVTNARVFADWLERQTASPIECMPVFSQVGEARDRLSFAERDRTMLVFGLAGTRRRAYRELTMPSDVLERLGVEEILDIGPDCDAPRAVNGIRVRSMGVLAAAEVGRLFTRAAFGYLAYPPNCLAKSGVFAAYSAHGVVPMIAEAFRGEFDGLKDGEQVLSRETAKGMDPAALERCSLAAWRWYAGHSLRHHAAIYDRWLPPSGAAAKSIEQKNG